MANTTIGTGIVFHTRLLPHINEAARQFIFQRGDLTKLVLAMFETIDLKTVEFPEIKAVRGVKTDLLATTIYDIPEALRTRLRTTAKLRGASMNELMNGAVYAYCKILQQKYGRSRQRLLT